MKPVDDIEKKNLGPALDRAIDYRIELEGALSVCRRVYTDLDGVADGKYPDAPTRHAREAQQHIGETIAHFETENEVVQSRIDAIRERIDAADYDNGD